MTNKRPKRELTDEFKLQMFKLYNSRKPRSEITKEYNLTTSALNNWIRRMNTTGSIKECDKRMTEE